MRTFAPLDALGHVADRLRHEPNRRVLVTSTALRRGEIADLVDLTRDAKDSSPLEIRFRVATRDRRLAALLEPKAASPSLRLASLRAARRAGLVAGIVVAPLIPGVTAHEGDLAVLLADARASGVSFVDFEIRFLDPARTAALLRTLRRHYPRVAARYEVWLRTAQRSPADERARIGAQCDRLARRFALARRIERRAASGTEESAAEGGFALQQQFSFAV